MISCPAVISLVTNQSFPSLIVPTCRKCQRAAGSGSQTAGGKADGSDLGGRFGNGGHHLNA